MEKRRRRRRLREDRRREHKEKARVIWSGVTGKLRRARRDSSSTSTGSDDPPSPTTATSPTASTHGPAHAPAGAEPPWIARRLLDATLAALRTSVQYLRHSHIAAAQRRAPEQVARMNAAFGEEAAHDTPDRTPVVHGWGLGSFGLRQRERQQEGFEMDGFEGLVRRRHGEHEEPEPEEAREGGVPVTPAKPVREARTSMWWWGPLRRWRLQDSTVY